MKVHHSLPRRRGYALEHDAQVALFRWAKLTRNSLPKLWDAETGKMLMAAIPNGGWRHITTAASLKDEGVSPGFPDIIVAVQSQGFGGLFIEMKRLDAKPKSETAKGPLSDDQIAWMSCLTRGKYLARVCYGSAEAIELVTWYLTEDAK